VVEQRVGEEPEDEAGSGGPARRRVIRIAALVTLTVVLVVLGRFTSLGEWFSIERIRETMQSAGALGFLIFVAVFAVGELLHIPGILFVVAAIGAYGRVTGGAAAYAGAVVSVCVSFFVVRGVGGQPLVGVTRPFFRKILDRLEEKPVRVVALLRLMLWMTPPLNYALAMSNVRFREYLIGSMIGLVIPMLACALFIDWVVQNML